MHYSEMSQALLRDEIRERTEEVNGELFTIVSYMVASPDLWDVPNAIEARGITFNAAGECVSRTMPKFFNINENKYTQLADLDFTDALVYAKLDGSMITPVLLSDGSIRLKTKKSFYSSVALEAQAYLKTKPNLVIFCKYMLHSGYTPSFEFESPNSQIVVTQTEQKLTLLLARNIKTGEELPYNILKDLADVFCVPLVFAYKTTEVNYLELAKQVTDIEGWVFLLKSGQRVKLKTDWYLRRHRLTSYHERNIFDLVMEESLDDIMPLLHEKPELLTTVNNISHRIANLLLEAETSAKALASVWEYSATPLPEIGKQYSTNLYFPLAIKLHKGQEPDYKQFVIRNYRNSFHTNPVFWGFDTDA